MVASGEPPLWLRCRCRQTAGALADREHETADRLITGSLPSTGAAGGLCPTRSGPAYVAVPEVGEDGEDAAVGVVGLGEAQLREDVADVLAHGRVGHDEAPGAGPLSRASACRAGTRPAPRRPVPSAALS